MSKIRTITVTNSSTSATETIPAAISQIYYGDDKKEDGKHNLNIATDADDVVSGKGGKINIEAASDIQFKPGDDMILYSHHRAAGKNDEVALKVTNGDDYPVKLQLNAANLTVTTKGKDLTHVYTTDDGESTSTKSGQVSTTSEDEIFDVNINTGKSGTSDNKKGYLKVRARAIDLRCEEHGGIALQPKGNDSDGNENKIKFEHGGGDGLEFLTMNTKHTSIFTDDYRFNKEGKVYMATRATQTSDKADANDTTTAKQYVKQSDDFYDVISSSDTITTWESIIKAGYNNRYFYKKDSSGNIFVDATQDDVAGSKATTYTATATQEDIDNAKTIISASGYISGSDSLAEIISGLNPGDEYDVVVPAAPSVYSSVNIKSSDKIGLKAPRIELDEDGIIVNTEEAAASIVEEIKNTAKGNKKGSFKLSVTLTNNATESITYEGTTCVAGTTTEIMSADLLDVIKLVNYMKTNNQGPWTTNEVADDAVTDNTIDTLAEEATE